MNDDPDNAEIVYDYGLSGMAMTLLYGFGPNSNPFVSPQNGSVGGQFVFEAFLGTSTTVENLVYKASYEFWTYATTSSPGALFGQGPAQNLSAASITALHLTDPTFTEGYTVALNNLSCQISLGQFNPGETKDFMIRTSLVSIASSYEHNVKATFGDPGDFGTFARANTPVSPVPLPAAGLLLLAALFGLGAIRKVRVCRYHSA